MQSDARKYRLSESTYAEPLVNQWYAHAYTMAPATAALHLVNYQLKVLRSYLENPQLHAQSCADKRFLGGPFVAIDPKRSEQVAAFHRSLVAGRTKTLAFAEALASFQKQLAGDARGLSIEPHYDKLPEPLRGLCELGYDYYNHPVVRLVEPLVRRSAMAREQAESWMLCRQERDGERPFFLSTPRLPRPGAHHFEAAFDDPRVDALFSLETEPRPLGEIAELLGVEREKSAETLLPLLSPADAPVHAAARWNEERPRIRYFGHACLLIEYAGTSILVDPNIAVVPAEGGIDRFGYRDLPPTIDAVLVTHAHADHFLPEVIARLRRRVGKVLVPNNHGVFVGDVSLAGLVRRLGLQAVAVEPYDEISVGRARVVPVPFLGEHCDLLHAKTAFLVQVGGRTIFVGADSNYLDGKMYEDLHAAYGDVDAAFLGMECVGAPLRWQYGTILPEHVRHEVSESRRLSGCDARKAVALLSALGARRAFVYAMGREPWLEYLMALAPSEDAVQMIQARKALAELGERGVAQCEHLIGKFETFL